MAAVEICQPLVHVTPIPGYNHALRGVVNKIEVLLQVATGKVVIARPALELALVVDRSGSMQGPRIKNAKRAVKKVIKHLEPTDAIHLVTYDSTARTVFQNGDLTQKETLKERVRNLVASGGTSIMTGLIAGYNCISVQPTERTAVAAKMQRLMLFSDGEDSPDGLHDKAKEMLERRGITTTTFGIGDGVNTALMQGISTGGKGEYFFIADCKSIPATMSKAIHGLLGTIGTSATIQVQGKNGAIVSKVFGHDERELISGIQIGDLHEDSTKQILLQLELGSETASRASPGVKILEFTLAYTSTSSGALAEMTGSVDITFTEDKRLMQERNPQVTVALAIQNAATMDAEISQLLTRGNKAEAITMKEALLTSLRATAAIDKTGRIAKLITRADKVLAEMKASRKSTQVMAKKASFHAKCDADDDDFGFSSGSDSDSGAYSDEGDGASSSNDSDSGGSGSASPPPKSKGKVKICLGRSKMPPARSRTPDSGDSHDSDSGS
ncbi:Protein lifeguard 2 [Pelomyxa schiedti]|nr:Protein lifeguard 2 [Pelomyxa schiedti]